MNHSPNSLRDLIRTENSDLAKIGVVEVDGNHYVTESSIINFMNEYDLDSRSQLIESLIDFNHIRDLSVLDENTTDEDLVYVRDVMMLCEEINPFAVADAAQGRTLLRVALTQMVSIFTRGKYTQLNDVERYIKKCDKMLEDIQEEKKNIREKKSIKGQVKFSCMFLFNLGKTYFINFVIPSIVAKQVSGFVDKHVVWPEAIKKLYIDNGKKAATGIMVRKVASTRKISAGTIANAALNGVVAALTIPPDIKGLYLSISDYDRLLSDYEREIKTTKNYLIREKRTLERTRR